MSTCPKHGPSYDLPCAQCHYEQVHPTYLVWTLQHSDEPLPAGPAGNCATCGLPLGERPPKGHPALISDDGSLIAAGWWWDFDPAHEDEASDSGGKHHRYCARHCVDTTEPEVFAILRGEA